MHSGGVPHLEYRPIRLSHGGTTRHIMRPRLTPTTGEAETCGMIVIDGGKQNGRECRAMFANYGSVVGTRFRLCTTASMNGMNSCGTTGDPRSMIPIHTPGTKYGSLIGYARDEFVDCTGSASGV